VAEAQLMAWQEQVAAAEARTASAEAAHEATAEAAQAAALQHPRMMRLHAPGAGFMSTRDFALRLTEAGLKRERGPQTRAPPSTSTTSSPTQVSHLAFSLRLLTDLSFILAPCHSQMAGQIISTTTCSRSVGASICPSRTASTPSTATCNMAGRLKAEGAAVKIAQRVAANPNLHKHIPIRDTEKGTRTLCLISGRLLVRSRYV